MRKLLVLSASFLLPMLLPAVPVTFTGSSAAGSASALFDTSGSNLVVTLTNAASTDALIQTHILTGVFFSFTSGAAPALTTVSAVLGSGSVVNGNGGATGAGGSVGGEWAYKGGISVHGQDRGISSAALGAFGPGDVFPGSGNLEGPPSPNGVQYGITTAGDNPATGNGGISGVGLIKNSVVFTLSGLSTSFDPDASVSSVIFQYGADLTDPTITGIRSSSTSLRPSSVPEPTSALLFGTLVSFIGWKYKRRSAQS